MAVLYPNIVNAYTKFAQNCVYFKHNFSVLPSKHHSACEKRTAWLISISALIKSNKMYRFVDLKRRIVFSRWYPTIAKKMEKNSG